MELQVKDRIYFPNLLPKEGNFMEFNLKKSILSKVEISQQEQEEMGFRKSDDGEHLLWDVEKDTPLTIMFTHEEMNYLKEVCEKISDQALPDDMWATVEKVFNAIQNIE